MAIIQIPEPLRRYTANNKKIEIHGSNVGSTLKSLSNQYPQLKEIFFNSDGNLNLSFFVFLEKRDIRDLKGLETPLKPDDTLKIVMNISGG